jgi:hypothetical protein
MPPVGAKIIAALPEVTVEAVKTDVAYTTAVFTASTVTSGNAAIILAPTGGMGQFKGLTQGTQ